MPKTAQEWKDTLDFDTLPDAELLELLNEAEGHETSGGNLTQTLSLTPAEIKEVLLVEGVGMAFKAIRSEKGLSTRSGAHEWHLSQGRVSQIEQPGVNLELATVADLAQRMGYRTRIVFEPVDGGQTISATLDAKKG
ncbi:helix-turn-helix domain-containing protein [Deinococcus sp.]|uniref:helix-turn-helix domain-containing protein n=1 Tax=Deinococcus sp. TaxID=47478 RepID=UPI003CC65BB3